MESVAAAERRRVAVAVVVAAAAGPVSTAPSSTRVARSAACARCPATELARARCSAVRQGTALLVCGRLARMFFFFLDSVG